MMKYTGALKLFLPVVLVFIASVQVLAANRSASFTVFSAQQEPLGSLTVQSAETDSTTRIQVVSEFKAVLLITVLVKYTLTSMYKNQELVFNSIKTYRNQELNSVVSTVKAGNAYRYLKDGKESEIPYKIPFAESRLYFDEPLTRSVLYSEFDGIEKLISKVAAGHYRIKNPKNGNVSEYFYENGMLNQAIVHTPLMTLFISKN